MKTEKRFAAAHKDADRGGKDPLQTKDGLPEWQEYVSIRQSLIQCRLKDCLTSVSMCADSLGDTVLWAPVETGSRIQSRLKALQKGCFKIVSLLAKVTFPGASCYVLHGVQRLKS